MPKKSLIKKPSTPDPTPVTMGIEWYIEGRDRDGPYRVMMVLRLDEVALKRRVPDMCIATVQELEYAQMFVKAGNHAVAEVKRIRARDSRIQILEGVIEGWKDTASTAGWEHVDTMVEVAEKELAELKAEVVA